jgi:hypothetical protein
VSTLLESVTTLVEDLRMTTTKGNAMTIRTSARERYDADADTPGRRGATLQVELDRFALELAGEWAQTMGSGR